MGATTADIGKVVFRVTLPVERGKIREFARAVHADHPQYVNRAAAAAAGFDDVPAPPTFTAVAAHFADDAPVLAGTMSPARAATEILGLDVSRTVNGEQGWEFDRIPQAGDELHGTSVIADVQHKVGRRGGASTHVTVITTYQDQRGRDVLRERVTIIELASTADA